MNKRIKSAIGCAVLFILSAVILFRGSDTGLPSEDYGMSVKEVFYMYGDEVSAVNPVSAGHILNITAAETVEGLPQADDEPCEVLPPVLQPPQTAFASDIN